MASASLIACEGDLEDGAGGAAATGSGVGTEAAGTTGASDASSSTGEEDQPPPTANAGQDQTVTWPIDRVLLHAAVTTADSIHWDQIDGPATSVVRNPRSADAVATALRIGDTTFRISVENEEGETAEDDVTVHVLPPSTDPATPLDWSGALPRPTFRAAHGLPPLTRWTGTHVLAFQRQMAERYGYAIDLGDTSPGWDEDFANPNGTIAQKIALKALDPVTYKLSIMVWRPLVDGEADFYDAYPEMRLRGADGEPNGGFSPEAPDALFEEVAEMSASRLRAFRQKIAAAVPDSPRVDVVLNGGEYGLGIWGDDDAKWLDDAVVRAAIEDEFDLAEGEAPTEDQMFAYISERKAQQEQIITDAHVEANPGGQYVYYTTWSVGWKERWDGWWRYAWDFPTIATLSSPAGIAIPSIYYRDYASQDTGWDGDKDSLSQLTNAQAWQQDQGAPLQYLSTCGGWPHEGSGFGDDVIADDTLYMGYLKAAYTVGLLGGIGGYFSNPGWGDEETATSDEMPNWLRQLVTLGEVHALFSHLEGYVRHGTLVPGPDAHRWSTGKPAYELPALLGGEVDEGVRVIARRSQGGSSWLVTVWAFEGDDREVAVTVDDALGELRFEARGGGSVYVVTLDDDGEVSQKLLDPDPMLPTDTLIENDDFQ